MIKLIGFYDYTVILTYMSLCSAVVGMTFASRDMFVGAILCLVFSGFCDMFDGMVARSKKNRTEDEKAFGIQLDSLCDVVSFGIFPAMICYHNGADGIVGIILMALFGVCAVIRLAFFNVLEAKRQQVEAGCGKFYRGLPVTSVSIILPCLALFRLVLPEVVFEVLLHVMLAVVAFLFIYDFSVKKIDWMKVFKAGRKAATKN